jgi:hypothetical protein
MSPLADIHLRQFAEGFRVKAQGRTGKSRKQEEQAEKQEEENFASNSSLSASNHWPR